MGGQNRIVVDYGDYEGLVLLGAFDTKSGVEICGTELENLEGFEVVTTYKTWGEGYDLLKEEISKDKEGYVIRFKNGFRMKIKGEEYKRLHKLLTGISSKNIWEYLKDKKPIEEFLHDVPDEFYNWVKKQINQYNHNFSNISNYCEKIHDTFRYGNFNDKINDPTKKDFALHLVETNIETSYKSILFAMWDEKPYGHIIWKIMKPKYEKPFKNDEN